MLFKPNCILNSLIFQRVTKLWGVDVHPVILCAPCQHDNHFRMCAERKNTHTVSHTEKFTGREREDLIYIDTFQPGSKQTEHSEQLQPRTNRKMMWTFSSQVCFVLKNRHLQPTLQTARMMCWEGVKMTKEQTADSKWPEASWEIKLASENIQSAEVYLQMLALTKHSSR